MILLIQEILHQLRLVVDPINYRILYIPGVAWLNSSINSIAAKDGPWYFLDPKTSRKHHFAAPFFVDEK